ncbi:MAG: ATP-binding protein [Oscillospiraceae bacterium]|nr:ATP-binding protein [Oscillospiraceae bacterium]
MKKARIRQSTILCMTGAIITLIALVLLDSATDLCQSIQAQNEAETNRASFQQLGQQLKDGSDYLTDQARTYVVTHSRAAMQNYWYEADVSRRRDKAVQQLTGAYLPAKELAALKSAKANSDRLMKVETHSMRLIAESDGLPLSQMSKEVAAYRLPADESSLTKDAKSQLARKFMFDDFYKNSKNGILNPIAQFQSMMSTRLALQLKTAKERTARSVGFVAGLDIVALFFVSALAALFHHFYLAPIKENIQYLQNGENQLKEGGAWELQELTGGWNHLSQNLQGEITRRKELEKDLVQAKEKAEAGSKAKSLFLAQMSHEIRTPLNTITGYLQLLEDTPLNVHQRRCFACVSEASHNLLGILNNVLDFSKLEAGQETLIEADFDLHEMLSSVYGMFRVQAEQKGIQLSLQDEVAPVYRWIYGDEKKLRQICINLVGNAVKFTSHGSVSLRVWVPSPAVLQLSVADTGPGIKQKDQKRIFESFEQADASASQKAGGTGLGLSISSGFLKLMGGRIALTSRKGSGSVFTVSLPLHPGKQRDLPVLSDASLLFGKKVLVVDNDQVNLLMEKEMLQKGRLSVSTADGGKKAIALCQTNRYDVILLDVRMSGMDGCDTAREIRRSGVNRFTPIAALSADAVDTSVRAAQQAGMDAYLLKPIDRGRLFQNLEQLCQTRHCPKNIKKPLQAQPEGILEALSAEFENGDFHAVQCVKSNALELQRLLPPPAYARLQEAAESFDMAACASLLRSVLAKRKMCRVQRPVCKKTVQHFCK